MDGDYFLETDEFYITTITKAKFDELEPDANMGDDFGYWLFKKDTGKALCKFVTEEDAFFFHRVLSNA